jgi:hypothetical protein
MDLRLELQISSRTFPLRDRKRLQIMKVRK